MPEYVIDRAHLNDVLAALYRENRERLVFAMPDGEQNVRVITVVDESTLETRA